MGLTRIAENDEVSPPEKKFRQELIRYSIINGAAAQFGSHWSVSLQFPDHCGGDCTAAEYVGLHR